MRLRSDGWNELRQCAFLAELYLTGSASEAARRVGMSRASAYRLRGREDAADFAHAWDAVLTPPGSGRLARPKRDWRKVTTRALIERLEAGLVQPVLYQGRMTAIRRKPDKTSLFRLLRRADAGWATLDRREAGR
ncbi:hypothetical protein QQS45_01085 [Alteriqipengyuania flavescens]|uniref:hypothetical protein n=1 Tax=Alteriqipengyuania flavescens TaxID=3053610 RepID=UPI0025B4E56D|nr:hypothetical protein [Alteriqipengyuania flavescens]WJY18877.1 hypothetical protein QQW98_01085 [Alteriqipengyuania flavescens]WJY24817.1 hypothetical protein QQS45_01085 [Alteriqipengyuania flavescens]